MPATDCSSIYKIRKLPRALELYLQLLKIAEDINDKNIESSALGSLADLYFYSGDIIRSINYSYKAIESNRNSADRTLYIRL